MSEKMNVQTANVSQSDNLTAGGMNPRLRRIGFQIACLNGFCGFSSGIIVSLLQEKYGLNYSLTGVILSFMSIGNMAAAFLTGFLPAKIGTKLTVLTLSSGYFLGYLLSAFLGIPGMLLASFFMVGMAKGCSLNTCTYLVGNNSEDRGKSLQVQHGFTALGALLSPFFVNLILAQLGVSAAVSAMAFVGLALWGIMWTAGLPGRPKTGEKRSSDYSFLKSTEFWLLTALVFCQNAAEYSVNGWLVSYYKTQGILTGVLSSYTITIMWTATLIARMLIAFVIPVKNRYKALTIMGFLSAVTYVWLTLSTSAIPAVASLFAFAFALAGINPMAVSLAGNALSQEGIGVLLPVASIGGIIMPSVIGIVAESIGFQAGIATNLVPCFGIVLFGAILFRRHHEKTEN